MRVLKRIFCMVFHCKNDCDNNTKQMNVKTEYKKENGDVTTIKCKPRFQRTQYSIKEIFLMCMEPFM